MKKSNFKFDYSSLDAMKRDCGWPDNYTATSAFRTILVNESLTTDPMLGVMFNFTPQEFRSIFDKPQAGFRRYYANDWAVLVASSKSRNGEPIDFKSFQQKFRALLVKVLGHHYFKSAADIFSRNVLGVSPTEIVPNYDDVLARCEITEEELVDAFKDFDANYDGPGF